MFCHFGLSFLRFLKSGINLTPVICIRWHDYDYLAYLIPGESKKVYTFNEP